jgi:hypothetical protein
VRALPQTFGAPSGGLHRSQPASLNHSCFRRDRRAAPFLAILLPVVTALQRNLGDAAQPLRAARLVEFALVWPIALSCWRRSGFRVVGRGLRGSGGSLAPWCDRRDGGRRQLGVAAG